MKRLLTRVALAFVCAALANPVQAQGTDAERAAVLSSVAYRVVPNVVYGVADGYPFQVLEYIDGVDTHELQRLSKRKGGMTLEVALPSDSHRQREPELFKTI